MGGARRTKHSGLWLRSAHSQPEHTDAAARPSCAAAAAAEYASEGSPPHLYACPEVCRLSSRLIAISGPSSAMRFIMDMTFVSLPGMICSGRRRKHKEIKK